MKKKPNILFIITDQWRYDGLGVNGNKTCKTPNLDKLAQEGINFTHAFTTTSLCTPARASLFTGRYPHNHGLLNNTHERDAVSLELPKTEVTLAQIIKKEGYKTSYVGKWHVGRDLMPDKWGFDIHCGSEDDFTPYENYRKNFIKTNETKLSAEDIVSGTKTDPKVKSALKCKWMLDKDESTVCGTDPVPVEGTATHFRTNLALEQLDKLNKITDPFCLFVSYFGPHYPSIIPEPFASMYDPEQIPEVPNFKDDFKNKSYVHHKKLQQWGVEKFTWKDWQKYIAFYWGYISFLDYEIGRILDRLKENGMDKETIVIFTTDHGDFAGSHRQFNKGPLMYDETYRIPLIIKWPEKTKAGSVSDSFVRILDLMPTILESAGAEIPGNIDGRSIVPILEGKVPQDWPQEVFCEQHGDELGLYSQRMIRTREYKYVYNVEDKDEMYDLVEDPYELNNCADDPQYKDTRINLEKKLLSWMRKTDDMIARWAASLLGGRK
ncbi:MAG: hypothetical protein A2252_06930 [Elusimicrobia bacterium RIFOXYA2_FULL_39_19]|nr:MAG: hypothetical protein A2252_06930 [Elusimicrobia bacterium RIFOXYA2_FULL_39_19]